MLQLIEQFCTVIFSYIIYNIQTQPQNMYQDITSQYNNTSQNPSTTSPILLNIFSHTQQTIHLYNKIMSQQYLQNLNMDNLEGDLAKFFNALIMAQKKNPLLVYQMFQMKSCHNIIQKYININPIIILRNSILLLGNCQVGGLVAQQLVQYAYAHCLLHNILNPELLNKYKQEIGQYIGNFMKCYYKLFKIQWFNKFILQGNYFQLLQINLRYYNCPDFMARTNAFNIVLDLIHHEEVRQFITNCYERQQFYNVIFQKMTQLFRNQLAQFGLRIAHISQQDNVDYIFTQLQDKIALWYDISNNFKNMEKILEFSFCKNIIVPLIIGPVQSTEIPLFSLKYSLYVLRKLIPTMKNLKILEIFESVFYEPDSLRKAFIQLFSVQKLLSKQVKLCQYQEKVQNKKIKGYYKSIFSSKDNHFILMLNCLLKTLFQQAHTCPQLSKNYGFQYNGQFCLKISGILLTQLKDTHHLHTIQSILDTLIQINSHKSLSSELQNQYFFIYQDIINQLKNALNPSKNTSSNQNILHLGQILQYDVNFIHKIQFGIEKNYEKYQNIYKIVFEWQINKQQMSCKQFYARMPDSPAQYLRYLFIKFMLLNKCGQFLLDNRTEQNLYQAYYQKMLTHCPYIRDDVYNPQQLLQPLITCQFSLKNEKDLSTGYIIKNNNFFVCGRPKGQRILITHGIKLKHITLQQQSRKKIKISIKYFNTQIKQLQIKQIINIKFNQDIIQHIQLRYKNIINKNIDFVKGCLKNAEIRQEMPSLI